MSKKSRRSRLKHRRWSNPQSIAIKEVGQPPQVLPLSPKQVSVVKSTVTTFELARHQYVRSDLRRTLITAAVIFALLIILYLVLR